MMECLAVPHGSGAVCQPLGMPAGPRSALHALTLADMDCSSDLPTLRLTVRELALTLDDESHDEHSSTSIEMQVTADVRHCYAAWNGATRPARSKEAQAFLQASNLGSTGHRSHVDMEPGQHSHGRRYGGSVVQAGLGL